MKKLHRPWFAALLGICALLAGCKSLGIDKAFRDLARNFQDKKKKDSGIDDDFDTKTETKLIGEYTTFAGLNMLVVEGVGLVVGLDGTGGDPPPSKERTALLTAMRKNKVKQPNRLLADPNTALVIVRAYLPPLAKKGDVFDVEVRTPDGGNVTSLDGGWLLPTHLTEKVIVNSGRKLLDGHILAKAEGPVVITAAGEAEDDDLRDFSKAGLLRRGRIIGGAKSMKERHLTVGLRSKFKGTWMAQRVADQINSRFSSYAGSGSRQGLAKAKTDQIIELKLHPTYAENYPRYLQVIRHIAAKETPMVRRIRTRKLRDDLLDPNKTARAAMQLEAIGKSTIPILRAGLDSPHAMCRFHSALALCYLGQTHGIKELQAFAKDEPAFRVYALAALAATRDGEAAIQLRSLLESDSVETRYGAFRSLTTMNPDDPFVAGVVLPQNATRRTEKFTLHEVDTKGTPMVHLTQHHKSEVVLFGRDLEFRTPIFAKAGPKILISGSARTDKIKVARYQVGAQDEVRFVSPRITDVIRAVADLGGKYPEVTSLLMQTDRQGNLPGKLGIDSLPKPGRFYSGDTGGKSRVGNQHLVPNQFQGAAGKKARDPFASGENDESPAKDDSADKTEIMKPADRPAPTDPEPGEPLTSDKPIPLSERLKRAGRRKQPIE